MVKDWERVRKLAKTLLNYHKLNHELVPSDIIIGLGTNDPRVAKCAAELFHEKLAPLVIFTGNVSPSTAGLYSRPEAEEFANIAIKNGVPESSILIEPRSTNTGENASFSQSLLSDLGLEIRSAIAVQKPYMERRTFATFKKVWPELELRVTSPHIEYEDLPMKWLNEEGVINIIVGDFERIMKYPALGFQIEQSIPDEVKEAFEELVHLGFTNHLVK